MIDNIKVYKLILMEKIPWNGVPNQLIEKKGKRQLEYNYIYEAVYRANYSKLLR